MTMTRIRRVLVSVLVGAVSSVAAMAGPGRGTDVNFRGSVQRLEREAAGKGNIVVRLNQAELPVRFNSESEFEAQGNIVGADDVGVGSYVHIVGYFTTTGIVAKEIHVLDDRQPEFRIRGTIDSIREASSKIIAVNLPGGTVFADDNTKIRKHGSDDNWSMSQLTPGLEIDARGRLEDGRFLATSVTVGARTDDGVRVRFEGKLERIEGQRLFMDTRGGGTAVVVIDNSTSIKGSLSIGQDLEVRGKLNRNLEVESEWVKNETEPGDDKGNDVVDDKKPNPPDIGNVSASKQISLTQVAASGLKGSAGWQYERLSGNVEQEFEVQIEDAVRGREYSVQITFGSAGSRSAGSLVPDDKGRARIKLRSGSGGLDPILPAGKDVRDITQVTILTGGSAVLTGSF